MLLYHRIIPHSCNNKYCIGLDKFEEQMIYLKNQGYKTITPYGVFRDKLRNNPPKTIILSFDDGTMDHYNSVYPILKRYGYQGVFFIITKFINSPGSLSTSQIQEMCRDNMEIASHTCSHRILDQLDPREVFIELEKSKNDLEKICGRDVLSFAPPGGWYNDDVVKTARFTGYKAFFSCEIGTNDLRENPFVYKRIEVLSDMSINEFKRLLNPQEILLYKIEQTSKFVIHYILGSRNYSRLAPIINSQN